MHGFETPKSPDFSKAKYPSRAKAKKPKHVDLVLRFTSKEEKDYYVEGLIDGFGENSASFTWKSKGSALNAKIIETEPWHEEVYDQ